jgi:hypothetical protein
MKYTIDTINKTIEFEGTLTMDELYEVLEALKNSQKDAKDYKIVGKPFYTYYPVYPVTYPQPYDHYPYPTWYTTSITNGTSEAMKK